MHNQPYPSTILTRAFYGKEIIHEYYPGVSKCCLGYQHKAKFCSGCGDPVIYREKAKLPYPDDFIHVVFEGRDEGTYIIGVQIGEGESRFVITPLSKKEEDAIEAGVAEACGYIIYSKKVYR